MSSRNAWVVVLFGAIAAFVAWRLMSTGEEPPRASAPAPSAEIATTQATSVAQVPPAIAVSQNPAQPPPQPTPQPEQPPAAAPSPEPSNASAPAAPSASDIPDIPPGLAPDRLKQSLAQYERRAKQLETQLGAAKARGDAQEIDRIQRQLDETNRRLAILRAELAQ